MTREPTSTAGGLRPSRQLPANVLGCLAGYFLCALGNILMLHSGLGMNPWGVFHQGLAAQTGLTLGQATQAFGLFLIGFCLFFKVVPGFGTVLNMLCIGWMMDAITASALLPWPEIRVARWAFLLLGNGVQAFGCFVYLRQRMGAGPKDGAMLLLTRKAGLGVGTARMSMEAVACLAGFLMGGQAGAGTAACVLTFGPMLSFFFRFFRVDSKLPQENAWDTARRISGKDV